MQSAVLDRNDNPSIFLVEDEALVAHDIRQRLEAAGHTVSGVAHSGEEALRIIPQSHSTLVLMDVNLGTGPDGIEVATELRRLAHTPVMYLTAYSDKEILERAKATEPFGYIIKPFTHSLEISVELALQRCALQRKLSTNGEGSGNCDHQSNENLLKALETLLCSPGFIDLELGYDPRMHMFYAGCETAPSLNDLIASILLRYSQRASLRIN